MYLRTMEQARLRDPRGLIWRVDVPGTRRERMRGLLGSPGLPTGAGMLFLGCRSIHTRRMRFPIDAVFLDRTFRAVDVRPVPPGRWLVRRADAEHVMEVAAGSGLRPGDVLERL